MFSFLFDGDTQSVSGDILVKYGMEIEYKRTHKQLGNILMVKYYTHTYGGLFRGYASNIYFSRNIRLEILSILC
jgi:hypothetical protein